jgi:uncharacterized membrane protein YqhA
MKTLLESSRYIVLVVVACSAVLCIGAIGWGILETANVISKLLTAYKDASTMVGSFVQVMDIFLIAAALYIFTVALYELFIGDLNLPAWLVIHNFDELKTLLSNLVILILAVSFAKLFLERKEAVDTLLYGAAVGLVAYVLILYRRHETSH